MLIFEKSMWSLFKQNDGRFLFCHYPTMAWAYDLYGRVNLLTGQREDFPNNDHGNKSHKYFGHKLLMEKLDLSEMEFSSNNPRAVKVWHLFYELGELLTGELLRADQTQKTYLAIEIEYSLTSLVKFGDWQKKEIGKDNEDVIWELERYGCFDDYHKIFKLGREELLDGNCYQFNLTLPYYYKVKNGSQNLTPFRVLSSLWRSPKKLGAYAHASYLPTLGQLVVSNSPESLFESWKISESERLVRSMPIKGTKKLAFGETNFMAYKHLANSRKDQAELFMIADLVRNDLSALGPIPRAKILKKRMPILAPGLVHQAALVQVIVPYKTSLGEVVRALFPGGSVTGAPKRRAIELLASYEKRLRRHYCGSTILQNKEGVWGSINIRTAEIDLEKQKLLYQTGGGITLLSLAKEEWDELIAKRESFMSI